jgi:hypothetical protein
MRADIARIIDSNTRELNRVKLELADANARVVTVRNIWSQTVDDLELEHAKKKKKKDKELKAMEERALNAERREDEKLEQYREAKKELYEVKAELEDALGRIHKLQAQLNKDYENSSISSSMKPNRKKIPNNREKTGRKPGGQPGHKGHGRTWREPTNRIEIEPPPEFADTTRYVPTGRIITKQMVGLVVETIVNEFSTLEFKDLLTGLKVHAPFPEGVINEVNYDGTVKAFAFMLNNNCNVSIDKTKDFMAEVTDGKLQISHGMICKLSKEFSDKTQKEQKEIFGMLLRSPVMGIDFTVVRVNGKNVQAAVCANTDAMMLFARYHKGFKGVEGTPAQDYQGVLVHDHDITFYKYGMYHQECNSHPLRYLKGSMENEQNLTWNTQMRELLVEMIHYRNMQDDDAEPNLEEVAVYREKYIDVLRIAKNEYEFEPPSDYYKDGYNLYKRMEKYIDNHLLFLYDHKVPATNNLCERILRNVKRKYKQVMTFRSFESLVYLCNSLSVIASLRIQEQNVYTSVADIFDKNKEPAF